MIGLVDELYLSESYYIVADAYYGSCALIKQLLKRFTSPLYGEKGVMLKVRTLDLMWEPAAQLIRFVLVDHPHRGRWMLMCTDLTLNARSIVRLYELRFKIELAFKQSVHTLGAFNYHFWMAG